MIALTAVEAVLNVAASFDATKETNGSNRGEIVDRMIRLTGLDPAQRLPWCAAFVAYVGYAVFRKRWPLKKVAGCMSLFADGKDKGMVRTTPEPGDIFLIWGTAGDGQVRFKHCGFVETVAPNGSCTTWEGNTNELGGHDGTGVFHRTRQFGPQDRFLRWAD